MRYKLLLSNEQAGALIGRNGGGIASIQASYRVVIRISAPLTIFLGAYNRVALLTGGVSCVHAALSCAVDLLFAVSGAWLALSRDCSVPVTRTLPRPTPPALPRRTTASATR